MSERIRALVEPTLVAEGFELVDVEQEHQILRITVDRPGGVDLDAISEVSRHVSARLDEADPLSSRYILEVSSPGVERPLRTPEHFRRFVGTSVKVRTRPGTEGDRRAEGVIESADDDAVVVDGRRIPYADIERARTVFVWEKAGRR